MSVFQKADILLPENVSFEKWAVVACDQFTSEKEYWQKVNETVKDAPSALRLVLPEAYLDHTDTCEIDHINATMRQYLADGLFHEYDQSYVYVERTLNSGMIRRGVVGVVDLEQYDFHENSTSLIRATEFTVPERIPPRMKIREDAVLELPHILMLCDDPQDLILGYCEKVKEELPLLYDFDLMMDGGRITGRLLQGKHAAMLDEAVAAYEKAVRDKYLRLCGQEIVYNVGDGNHSLATAKSHYEQLKKRGVDGTHPARFAMTELGRLQDDSLVFEPIHRLLRTDSAALLAYLAERNPAGTFAVPWFTSEEEGTVKLALSEKELPLAKLQNDLDAWLAEQEGEIDYIHGDDTLRKLARREGMIGFLVPPIAKDHLFQDILENGVLPRKTFSMGHANEKRYYIESRKIL